MNGSDLAMVAPSIHLWSADQLTFMTGVGRSSPLGEYLNMSFIT